jgi:hypothetical protein
MSVLALDGLRLRIDFLQQSGHVRPELLPGGALGGWQFPQLAVADPGQVGVSLPKAQLFRGGSAIGIGTISYALRPTCRSALSHANASCSSCADCSGFNSSASSPLPAAASTA